MIFVTGGTGLVGANLLLLLVEKNNKIRALKRANSNIRMVEKFFKQNKSQELFHKIEWIEGDLLDITFLPIALQGIKTIYHTAAHVSFNEKDADDIIENNVTGTENLINEAIDSGIEEFIYVSSIAAMDDLNPITKLIDEKSTWNNDISHSTYAISKYRAEMEVWRGSQEGLNVIVINPSVIIGALDGKRESERIFKDSVLNQYAPTGGTGFIDVRDVAKIIINLHEKKIYNQKFILNAENRSYFSVLNYVASKKNRSIKKISNQTLKGLQYITYAGQFFGLPYLNKATYKALTNFIKYDNTKIISTLDYQFIPVNEAIDYHYINYQKNSSK